MEEGSGRVPSGPDDVVVALSSYEKGEGLDSSYVAVKEAAFNPSRLVVNVAPIITYCSGCSWLTMGATLTTNLVHKRRPVAPEGKLALKEKVFRWMGEGLIRKGRQPDWITNAMPIKLANGTWKVQVDYSSINKAYAKVIMMEEDEEKTGFHMKEGVYCFIYMLKELKNFAATLQRMMERVLADQRGRNVEIYLEEIVIKSKKEGLRADTGSIQAIILSLTPRSPNQIRSLFLQLTTINKFISKLVKLKHPIRKARTRMEKAKEYGWTNEAEEALQRIKRKLSKLQTLAIPKEGEDLMLCLRQRNETISSMLLVEGEESRYLFPMHKVKVVTDGPMEETIKLARREGRLGKWATDIRTYDISYVQRKVVEGTIVKKFFSQREQVEETPDTNKGGIFDLSKGFQENSTPTTRAWRLYLGRETIEEGSSVGIILISPREKMYSYVIRLKFKASNHTMDCEALLAGLAASTNQGMKDLHVFINSLTLVAQVEGNHTPTTEQERRSVNRDRNYKARIPQSGSISRYQNKTIDSKKGKATSKALREKPNCNHEASGSN
uniref:RNase H type-1 domain-containing protein n=1 Tax=Tanacetum cinerariifolium TaxID=118510 RepID=A0A6L2N5X8_TANCI|nr:hypothetical protein [Tanacetum cinerariifolium]